MDACVVTDFEKVCRICMKFDKTLLSITSFKIIDMIIACASVQIWENDDLPNQICHDCFLQLQNTFNFKELCENSDNTFRQIIEQNKINLSNNQNDFDNVKEEFNNYADDNSPRDIKQEDISENNSNESTLENVKVKAVHNEVDPIIKDSLEFNIIKIRPKSEDARDSCDDKDDENVIETFYCEKCNREFKKLSVLGLHMYRKHRAKALKCNKCELKFYHQLHLKEHQELRHNTLNLTCNKCKRVFISIYTLKRHKLKYACESLHCQQCDKSFEDKNTLKCHNKEVHGFIGKKVTCHVCGKLVRKRRLADHLVIHKERNKITCDICSKTFLRQQSLIIHKKEVHENKIPARNHLCNICGYATRTANTLQKHLVIHSNERPYACDHCDKTYRRADHLKQHISHVHLNQRKHQCTFCSQAFFDKRTFVHHVRRHTGEKPHICEVCDKRFIQKIALKIHMKIHSNSRENPTQRLD